MKNSTFLNRDFLLISQGQLVNQVGTRIALAATAFWLKQSTDSASLVGLMSAISGLPLLLLGPLGGAFADRWSRRNILIVCDFCCGLVACAMAILLQLHVATVAFLTMGLFLGNLVLSSSVAFTSPALNALIPSLVAATQVAAAMAFAQAFGLISLILGQVLGGLLLTHYLPAFLFWLDAGTYFIAAAAESLVRADPKMSPEQGQVRPAIFHDMKEGFRYVWRKRGMRALLLAAIPLNVLTTPVIVLLPFYTTNSLGQPLARYGYLLAALSAGMLIGYGLGGTFPPPPRHRHTAVFACVVGCATAVVALSILQAYWEALIVLGILGCLIGVVTLISLSVFIQQTEPEKRGRVSAVLLMVTQGMTPLAMSLIGVVSDLLGHNMRLLYAGCGGLLYGSAVAMFANRDLRDFLRNK
jgi:MFS transporter, DHA3 family, macrolide efflux protein